MQEIFAVLDCVEVPVVVMCADEIIHINSAATGIDDIENKLRTCKNVRKLTASGVEYTIYTLDRDAVRAKVPDSRLCSTLDCVREAVGADFASVYYLDGQWSRRARSHKLSAAGGIPLSDELDMCRNASEGECACRSDDDCSVYIVRSGSVCLICAFVRKNPLSAGERAYLQNISGMLGRLISGGRCVSIEGDSGVIFNNPSVSAVWLDVDLNIVDIKGSAFSGAGRDNREYIGRSLFEFDFDHRMFTLIKNAVTGQENSMTVTLGGEWYDVYTSCDTASGVPLICALLVKTTDSGSISDSYANASGSLDIVALSLRIGFWTLECETGRTTCDEGCCSLWDIPYYPESASADLVERISEADRAQLKEVLSPLALDPSNTSVKFDFSPVTVQGSERYIQLSAKPVWENGELTRIVGMMQDVTESRKMELAVHREQTQNDVMRHILLSCAYYGNSQVGIANSLQAAARLLGASQALVIFGRYEPWQKDVCPEGTVFDGAERLSRYSGQLSGTGFAIDVHDDVVDMYVAASDDECGAVMFYSRTGERWRDEDIAFAIAASGVVGMALRRSRMESQLRAAVAAAQAGNRAKSDFLSQMSHEIRTPLNVVLGMSLLASEQEDIGQVRSSLDKVISAGRHLHGIISDILDLNSIEAGKLELLPERMNIRQLIGDVCDMIRFTAQSKKLRFSSAVADGFPEYIIGDKNRIGQVLINLLNNAVKFTRKGGVGLDARLEGENMVFSVSDTGIGIKPEEKEKLFSAFERLDRESNRDVGGNGLGLHISNSLVNMMGGTLDVDSQYGKGSMFTARIPLKRAPQTESEITVELQSAAGVRALIVDDSDIGAMVTSGLLARYGISAEIADCASRALELVDSSGKYDIIFMDHMLPDYDGAEACRRLRAKGITTPIAALTANVLSEHRDEFTAAGADGFLSKPVEIKQLEQILIRLIDADKLILK